MSIGPLDILDHVESSMGIRLEREGDSLRMLIRPGADADAARERVRNLRDVLYEEVLQREMVELACGPSEQFDREKFDALFALWQEKYGVPWDTPSDMLPPAAVTRYEALKLGA